MALKYGLVLNHLTDDPDDCMAITTDNETVTSDQIVESMIGKGSTVTKAEALSVIEEFEYAVVDAIQNGNNVHTDLFKIYPRISGVFTNADDSYDASRHTIKLNMNPGSRLKDVSSNITVKKVEITSHEPVIQQLIDLKTNVINETFTPGQIASLKGSLLKFDEDSELQGIFFIKSDNTETKASNVVKNKPSELLFFVPESLSEGIFQVEVRTILYNSKTLKKGRLTESLVPVQ